MTQKRNVLRNKVIKLKREMISQKIELENKLKDLKQQIKEADEYDRNRRAKDITFGEGLKAKLLGFIQQLSQ